MVGSVIQRGKILEIWAWEMSMGNGFNTEFPVVGAKVFFRG